MNNEQKTQLLNVARRIAKDVEMRHSGWWESHATPDEIELIKLVEKIDSQKLEPHRSGLPTLEWVKKMADLEDQHISISVGGLAHDVGMEIPKAEPNYKCCPTHCCQVHGCKYCLEGCPVVTKKVYGMTGSCEECGLINEGYYGDGPKGELERDLCALSGTLTPAQDLIQRLDDHTLYLRAGWAVEKPEAPDNTYDLLREASKLLQSQEKGLNP